ncbi:MAG: type II toxin-antitoxin system VapC family toxin [Acidobacteriota bacterium]|nr:type II toxin-antitoxin system VapC family toxin [Acidobacteriota bacterium]
MIPFADLLIGGTALHFDYGLVTSNVRHFQNIPGLSVIPFWEQRLFSSSTTFRRRCRAPAE